MILYVVKMKKDLHSSPPQYIPVHWYLHHNRIVSGNISLQQDIATLTTWTAFWFQFQVSVKNITPV